MNLTQILYRHFKRHGRDLPWRHTHDPYAILVSEIMLQQTQVNRVITTYKRWMDRFPTITALFNASLPEVLTCWQGLGYNRRAKYLFDLSSQVVKHFHGIVPSSKAELLKLPGIGPYTASAVCVFAYNQPLTLIETNVRTVVIHHYFPQQSGIRDKDIEPIVRENLDQGNPRKWFSAMMDYGSYLKAKVGNANRSSQTYSKQSAFYGSLRQKRGEIIRQLTKTTYLDQKTVDQHALASLIKDGLVQITPDGEICLAQS